MPKGFVRLVASEIVGRTEEEALIQGYPVYFAWALLDIGTYAGIGGLSGPFLIL